MRLTAVIASVLCVCASLRAEDWPEFRGPTGQGHSTERGLPYEWNETKNVRWKVALPGKGWSSPVIQGSTIWLTAATESGKSLRLLTVDAVSGKITADREILRAERPRPVHEKNSFASPTPILDGDRLYVHFGTAGTACVRLNGEMIWKRQFDFNHVHGSGGSPALHGDLLVINCDGAETQYAVALDKRTGETRWKADRKTHIAYATPLVIRVGSAHQVISPAAHRTMAYDPATGRELWRVTYGDGFSNVPRPVFAHGLVYLVTGFYRPQVLAVRPDGSGDVTNSHVVWRLDRGAPLTPSPLVVGDELYVVSDNGIATCVDAKTGEVRWRERAGGSHSASPVFADGRIYFLSEEGESLVVAPGKTFRKLATNQLDGRFLASMAVSGGALYLRSETHLYRIQQ